MRSFFKVFFASLLAMFVFILLFLFIVVAWASSISSAEKQYLGSKAVLVLDLSTTFPERKVENPLHAFVKGQDDLPGIYDVIRMLKKAGEDSSVKGLYIKCNANNNGFSASEEIRNAIANFKEKGKFVFAYGDMISQKAYYVGSVADKIYCNPKGGVDWRGLSAQLFFLKGTLDRLGIQPQIFYAGKFKSATEPFRETHMTEPNRIQTLEILHDLFSQILLAVGKSRNIDTATLSSFASNSEVQFAQDALKLGLVDGLKYDDEIREEIKTRLKIAGSAEINFVSLEKFANAVDYTPFGTEKIALIYAQGDVVEGEGSNNQISDVNYRNLIRKAREDKSIKAIVMRVNSGGGSALASENIWREITLAKKEKPVVISFGDVAASGAYYISCNADSIFAEKNTITGSIGVFALIPNMQKFFDDKLGITFDGVETAPESRGLTITEPLSPVQKRYIQNSIDTIYSDFKSRVAQGRNISMEYVDSIAQGRVWSGSRALQLGLVDRIGGLQDAVDCAARMAKLKSYRLREYPESKNFFEKIFGNYKQSGQEEALQKELGSAGYKVYQSLKQVRELIGKMQARLPFQFEIN